MQQTNSGTNLEQLMTSKGGPLNMLRTSPIGSYTFPVVPAEYTSWLDEQRAWREDCAFLNLSYHQTDLYIRGPGALDLLKTVGINRFGDFPVGCGKQLIMAGHDGNLVADGIVFHADQGVYRVAGPPTISNWIQFNAENGGFDVKLERDEGIHFRGGDPKIYIFQVQGPKALDLMNEVTNGELPEIGFFKIGSFKIAGKNVKALSHGMVGQPGFEMFGPWEEEEAVREAISALGPKYGMRNVGGLAYGTTSLESGWIGLPVPAIYHSEEMKPYRQWLGPRNLEVMGSLGGSFMSDNIVDYYIDPIESNYGGLVDFNRDFIGRDALKEKFDNQRRKKVTLLWNNDDMTDVLRSSLTTREGNAKFPRLPQCVYSTFQSDQVMSKGNRAGISTWCGFSSNIGSFSSLSIIDIELAEPGTEVSILWGEKDSTRASVEPHEIREIRATVAALPYFRKVIKDG
jgi:vanillate/3-O-methylgallate O-demethylase